MSERVQETVHWEEEPERTRDVVRYCLQCQADSDFTIVSPQGTAHYASEHNEGRTRCGINAEGENWWWRT